VAETEIAQPQASATEPIMTMAPPPAEEPSALISPSPSFAPAEQAGAHGASEGGRAGAHWPPDPVYEPLRERSSRAEPEGFDDAGTGIGLDSRSSRNGRRDVL
jgi:hypothetical protein